MNGLKKIVAPILRAAGFVAIGIGGFNALGFTLSGGLSDAWGMWGVFVGGLAAVFIGDKLKKSLVTPS